MESTLKALRDGESVLDLSPRSTVSGGVEDIYGGDRATEDQLVIPWTVSVAKSYSHHMHFLTCYTLHGLHACSCLCYLYLVNK